jgi:DNA-3-methyladenine glycosylase I
VTNRSPSLALARCPWASNDLSIHYHDQEWGVPVHDDGKLFEFLILEGAQAGLSWDTVLKKRENYRAAFDGFDPEKIARYGQSKLASLLKTEGIIRNRLKIASAVKNAKAFLKIQSEFGSFDSYIWSFVDKEPRQIRKSMKQVPASTPVSDALSKELKKLGFTFVGTTICYAFMQAVGMVNDHLVTCFRYSAIASAKTKSPRL